jgi:hypothetical protein
MLVETDMHKIIIIIVILILQGCDSHRTFYETEGEIIDLKCEDIWRSSNVLKMTVKDNNSTSVHKFTTKLWEVDCEKAKTLLQPNQTISFSYEKSGHAETALVKLEVNSIVIVDNR